MEEANQLNLDGTVIAPVEAPKEEVKAEEVKTEVETEEVKTEEVATENVESLPQWAKDRLKKTEDEREIFKKGMLKYKKRTLEPEEAEEKKEVETPEEFPDWDETSKKFQQQTLSEAEKVAEKKVRQIIEKNNEQTAISQFLSQNPEAEEKWNEIVSNYSPKNGKESIQSILKDLDRAYIIARYESGTLTKPEKKTVDVSDLSAVSKTTSKPDTQKTNSLSQGSIDLAKKMRVDLTKLAEEDLSQPAQANF